MEHLISRICSEHIEGRRDELCFYRNRLGAHFFSCSEGFFDGIDPGGCVACQLDVCTELDRLRRESAGDCGY